MIGRQAVENALLIGLSRQVALSRELDVIANNMANVGTNGFKARSARFNEFVMPKAKALPEPLYQGLKAEAFKPADQRLSYVIDKGTPLDLSQGAVEFTGNPLDVALKDDNFLVVQTPAGERYTRAGSLVINRQGQLVTQSGQPVMGEAGPISFGNTEFDMRIAADGTVTSNQGTRGKLRQVRFADARSLVSDGANLFSSPTPPQTAPAGTRLEPGALERSNVKAVTELTRLMEVQRAYQNVANMISRSDDLRSKAISRLADQQA